jgi:hypothetical protein
MQLDAEKNRRNAYGMQTPIEELPATQLTKQKPPQIKLKPFDT